MSHLRIYEALASAFWAEGVRTQFTLMGDGNMHWATTMKNLPGMRSYYSRHEHCAVMMAAGYAHATGEVGIASVTCGPGFSQVMTALITAARTRTPIVLFAGESPTGATWYNQAIDQAPLAAASEALYIAAQSPEKMQQYVQEAFVAARSGRPVVLGVPYDLQKKSVASAEYVPTTRMRPEWIAPVADAAALGEVTALLQRARHPILLAGAGASFPEADAAVRSLADRTGALLATTLQARGLFDDHPFSIGVAGGWARQVAREQGEQADLVIAFGASLSAHTLDGGAMFPQAKVAQIDTASTGWNAGRRVADVVVRADAGSAARTLEQQFAAPAIANVRTEELRERIRALPADTQEFPSGDGLDPRTVIERLDDILPKDLDCVSGSGHQSYFHSVMRGRSPRRYHFLRGFGAIGNGISLAMGVEAARGEGRTVLFDGDGSFLMHVQELEVARRHGLKVLLCIFNDGAYGSEVHKLRAQGVDESGTVFGRPDFAAIANGFGLPGATITDLDQLAPAWGKFAEGTQTTVWDVHITDTVIEPTMRRRTAG